MSSNRKPRVAVYGGDGRDEDMEWPNHLDVQIYPARSPRTVDRLKDSLSSGRVDHLVVLTGYVGHGYTDAVKTAIQATTNVINWNRSPGQLRKEIGRMIPPPPVQNPLLTPSRPDDPMTGGGRGPLKTKTELVSESKTNVPMFEHVVSVPPRPDETFGQALLRILKAERMGQSELGRLIKKDASTVNGWIKDRGIPRDLGPLIDLWPELARFDKERTHKPAPTAEMAEQKINDDLDFIRSIKAEPKATLQRSTPDAGRVVSVELAATLARWRKQKEEMETTERYLLLLLRESGL